MRFTILLTVALCMPLVPGCDHRHEQEEDDEHHTDWTEENYLEHLDHYPALDDFEVLLLTAGLSMLLAGVLLLGAARLLATQAEKAGAELIGSETPAVNPVTYDFLELQLMQEMSVEGTPLSNRITKDVPLPVTRLPLPNWPPISPEPPISFDEMKPTLLRIEEYWGQE